jgi:hypothetical protein
MNSRDNRTYPLEVAEVVVGSATGVVVIGSTKGVVVVVVMRRVVVVVVRRVLVVVSLIVVMTRVVVEVLKVVVGAYTRNSLASIILRAIDSRKLTALVVVDTGSTTPPGPATEVVMEPFSI